MSNIYKVIILFTIILLCSCRKEVIVNFDEERRNIVGDWEVREDPASLITPTFDISFNEDGTGVRETIFGDEQAFEWLYQYNPEMVVISTGQAGLSLGSTQFYTVERNTDDEQIWTYESAPIGTTTGATITWRMEK